MNPDILLCDEPASSLDVATTRDVICLLEPIRDMGVSIIIASHDLDFLTKITDVILILKKAPSSYLHMKSASLWLAYFR